MAIQLAHHLCSADQHDDIPFGIVLEAPLTTIADVAASYLWLPLSLKNYAAIALHGVLYHRFPSISRMPGLVMPVLVIHGGKDCVVPYAHGEVLSAAAQKGTFLGYPEADHETIVDQRTFSRDVASWVEVTERCTSGVGVGKE